MSTIRKRDHAWESGFTQGEYWTQEHPETQCPADADRRALLLAGDAMLERLDAQHWLSEGRAGLCGGCGWDWPCPTRQAADRWKVVTDGTA